MKFDAKPALRNYEDAAGISLRTWALLALLDFLTQALLYHGMRQLGATVGEFGTLNAALGVVGLLAVPVVALHQAFRLFFARATNTRLDHLRDSAVTITETFAWAWAACCFLLIVLPLPLPSIPRFGLQILTLLNVLLALGGSGQRLHLPPGRPAHPLDSTSCCGGLGHDLSSADFSPRGNRGPRPASPHFSSPVSSR